MNDLARILTIDDDDDIRMIAAMALKKKGGFDVVSHSSGEAGLEYLLDLEKDAYPDLILLDVMMPHMDGPQTFEQIKAQNETLAQIPVIFLTAKCQPDQVEILENMGAKGGIAKPFDVATLAQQVRDIWQSTQDL